MNISKEIDEEIESLTVCIQSVAIKSKLKERELKKHVNGGSLPRRLKIVTKSILTGQLGNHFFI